MEISEAKYTGTSVVFNFWVTGWTQSFMPNPTSVTPENVHESLG